MSKRIVPLDPDSPAGKAAAEALSEVLAEILPAVERRRAANAPEPERQMENRAMLRQTIPHATWTRIGGSSFEVYQDSGTSALVTSHNGEDFDIEVDGKVSVRLAPLQQCGAEYEGWSCERGRGHDGRHTVGDGGRANGATWSRETP